MNEYGITPGPWFSRLEHGRFVIFHKLEIGVGEKALAVTAGSYPTHAGNARSIAEVPAMIEALEMAEDELTVAGNGSAGSATSAHLHKQAAKIRALLARIKGESA